jgi:glycosyltransferase involved in cell wall biosynthesis
MRVLLTLEDHLARRNDGHYYVPGPAHYSEWTELLDFFDQVVVLARAARKDSLSGTEKRVDGPSISVHGLPDYTGPWQYLSKLPTLRAQVRFAVAECDTYLLRVPGLVSRLAWREIRRMRRGYAAEVVGDPWDALGPETTPGLFRPLYRRIATRGMREICTEATSVLYWSWEALQRRYPPGKDSHSFAAPKITLGDGLASAELMAQRVRRIQKWVSSKGDSAEPLRIGYVGTFATMYKGPDTLLHALARCKHSNLNIKVLFVGEGRYRQAMEAMARNLSIQDRTVFLGQLGVGSPIVEFLDSVDLFVMPSRAEGFSRAFLEAMARGCPCIGTKVGAIPEMLADDDLVSPGDPEGLAQKIFDVTANLERMEAMSQRNLQKVKQFSPDRLREVRRAFYRSLGATPQSAARSST